MSAEDAELDCRAASRLLSLACERELAPNELQALARHIDDCLMCRNFSTQLQFLRKAASAYRKGD
jgi:hypothetical protein